MEDGIHPTPQHLGIGCGEVEDPTYGAGREMAAEILNDVESTDVSHGVEAVTNNFSEIVFELTNEAGPESLTNERAMCGVTRRVHHVEGREHLEDFLQEVPGRRSLLCRIEIRGLAGVPDVFESRERPAVELGNVVDRTFRAESFVDRIGVFEDCIIEWTVVEGSRGHLGLQLRMRNILA
jgi:hypothetical protein